MNAIELTKSLAKNRKLAETPAYQDAIERASKIARRAIQNGLDPERVIKNPPAELIADVQAAIGYAIRRDLLTAEESATILAMRYDPRGYRALVAPIAARLASIQLVREFENIGA